MGLTRPRAHQLQGSDYKQSVRAISTNNVTLSGGAPATVDDVSLLNNDRILVTGQTDTSKNGLYRVTNAGSGSNGTWARSQDGDSAGDITAGMTVMVTEGTVYGDTQWKLTTDDPITIGTTGLVFEQASAYSFGKISVGGTTLVADKVNDIFTVSAGNNIVLSGNASTDSFTVAVSDAPSFTGNVIVQGETFVHGNIIPNSDVTYNIGSPSFRFKEIYLSGNTIDLGGTTLKADNGVLLVNDRTVGEDSGVPGESGNDKDLATGGDNVTLETPFEEAATDSFGVSIATVSDLMDPEGSLVSIDYSDGETHVGA